MSRTLLFVLALTGCTTSLDSLDCAEGQTVVMHGGDWSCADLEAGRDGQDGAPGVDGLDGLDGLDGEDGQDGVAIGHSATSGPGFGWGGAFTTIAEVSFDLETSQRVLALAQHEIWTFETTCQTAAQLLVDGEAIDTSLTSAEIKYVDSGNPSERIDTSAMVDLAAGAHTIALQRSADCGWEKAVRLHVLELQPVTLAVP